MACILLLVLPGALAAVPANPQAGSDSIKLADVLTKGSWEYKNNAGTPTRPIALEGITLTFCAGGRVRETITDDTGLGELYGKWALEHTDDGDVLILSGKYLRDHGRFSIKYLEKEKAIDLSIGSPQWTLRFQSVKTGDEPCLPLADILTKESWAHTVPHIESITLTFCDDARVRLRTGNDTGEHDDYGTWKLQRTNEGDVLILSWAQVVWLRGRLPIKYLEKEKAFDLQLGSGEQKLRFTSVKNYERDLCQATK
jgi:hypothetical protein